VINTSCMLLYYPKPYIYLSVKLSLQDLFLSELIQCLISLDRDSEASHSIFAYLSFLLAFLSMHCESPYRRFHKPCRISTIKTQYIFLCLPPWPQPIIWVWMNISRKITRMKVPMIEVQFWEASKTTWRLCEGSIEDFKCFSPGKYKNF
jgi:hypothetical protein